MLLKRILVMSGLLSISIGLIGCEEKTITYKEKQMPISQVEEIIADELEVENPDLDLEVSITEDTD